MPKFIELDSSVREENPTIIIGKNILLKIIEDFDKEVLLKNEIVQKVLSIPNLCNNELREIIENLLEEDEYLSSPILLKTALHNSLQKLDEEIKQLKLQSSKKSFDSLKESEYELLKATIENFFIAPSINQFHFNKGVISEKQILEHEKKLWAIDKKIKEKVGFRITTPSVLFACTRCKMILSPKEIADNKCLICSEPLSEDQIDRIPVYKVPDEIKKLWRSNLWFESYFAKLLDKLGFQTWVGVYAMGASGILHEVDVLAIKKGTVVVTECKTGKVSRNDVFNFCTKINDLKAHVSILALIKGLPEPETREFLRKNPAIITLENMGAKEECEILEELKQRLPF